MARDVPRNLFISAKCEVISFEYLKYDGGLSVLRGLYIFL